MQLCSKQSMNMSNQFSPIFVVGCARSGTTLLTTLMDRHSDFASTPETVFLYKLHSWGRHLQHTRSPEQLVAAAFSIPHIKDMGIDPKAVLLRLRQHEPTLRFLFQFILEEYAQTRRKPRVVEKSPDHLLHVPTIINWYPAARIICIVRDGRDVVQSLLKVPWLHNGLYRHCYYWTHRAQIAMRYLRQFSSNMVMVRFEDLVAHPERELEYLFDFLGVRYEPVHELQAQAEHSCVVPARWMSFHKKALSPVDPSRASAWKSVLSLSEKYVMNSIMGRHLKWLNYDDIDLPEIRICDRVGIIGRKVACSAWYSNLATVIHSRFMDTIYSFYRDLFNISVWEVPAYKKYDQLKQRIGNPITPILTSGARAIQARDYNHRTQRMVNKSRWTLP